MPEPIGNDLERTTLPRAEQFQNLFLPFQVILLVVAGNAGVSDSASIRGIGGMKPLGA
jgi:hypothetical protein